jgi:hypothetical protein
MASKDNCLLIEGRATFTEEDVKGVRKELIDAISSAAPFEVLEAVTSPVF